MPTYLIASIKKERKRRKQQMLTANCTSSPSPPPPFSLSFFFSLDWAGCNQVLSFRDDKRFRGFCQHLILRWINRLNEVRVVSFFNIAGAMLSHHQHHWTSSSTDERITPFVLNNGQPQQRRHALVKRGTNLMVHDHFFHLFFSMVVCVVWAFFEVRPAHKKAFFPSLLLSLLDPSQNEIWKWVNKRSDFHPVFCPLLHSPLLSLFFFFFFSLKRRKEEAGRHLSKWASLSCAYSRYRRRIRRRRRQARKDLLLFLLFLSPFQNAQRERKKILSFWQKGSSCSSFFFSSFLSSIPSEISIIYGFAWSWKRKGDPFLHYIVFASLREKSGRRKAEKKKMKKGMKSSSNSYFFVSLNASGLEIDGRLSL